MDEMDRLDQVTEERTGKEKKKREKKEKKPDSKAVSILKRMLALMLTVILVVGAVFVVVHRDELSFDRLRRRISYRNSTGAVAQQLFHGADPEGSFAWTGSGLVTCSKQQLQGFDLAGEKIINESVNMKKPVVRTMGGYTVVYDAGGTELYLIHKGEIIQSSQATKGQTILSARVDSDGWLTVVERATGYKASVTVYNQAFKPVVTENISSSFITDAILSPGHKLLTLVSVGEAESGFESELQFYNVTDGERKNSCVLDGDVVLDLNWEKDVLWVAGEYGVYRVVNEAVESSYTEASSYLQGFSLQGDGFGLLFYSKYQGGSTGELVTVDEAGVKATLGINDEVLSISASGDYVAVLTASELSIYKSDLTQYDSVENRWGARRVLLKEDGSAVVISSESASLYVPE